jgi:branched-chain amino acid transport system substrate-binding protein
MTRASYAEEIEKITEQYVTTGYNRFAILYQDDAFGPGRPGSAPSNHDQESRWHPGSQRLLRKKHDRCRSGAVKAIAAAKPQAVILIANTAASCRVREAVTRSRQSSPSTSPCR